MFPIDEIAERRIAEAMDRGEFEGLPGAGKPLRLEDDSLVPEELRAGYRLLKNAGYLPEEISLRREISKIETLLNLIDEPATRDRAMRKLRLLETRLGLSGRTSPLSQDLDYRMKMIAAMDDSSQEAPTRKSR